MPNPAGLTLAVPITERNPRSYGERGACVAFTTPVLGGACVRSGPQAVAELVVCNPSGGRGVYIVPLEELPRICQPSLHDSRLFAELGALAAFTPAAIRTAARTAAATGLAGRAAKRQAALPGPDARETPIQGLAQLERLAAAIEREPGDTFGLAALARATHTIAADLVAGDRRLADKFDRLDWVLDGWDRIALLWRAAGAEALREIGVQAPRLPDEARGWCSIVAEATPGAARADAPGYAEDGMGLSDLVARNERVAAALLGPGRWA